MYEIIITKIEVKNDNKHKMFGFARRFPEGCFAYSNENVIR